MGLELRVQILQTISQVQKHGKFGIKGLYIHVQLKQIYLI